LIYSWWAVRDLAGGLRPLAECFAWIKDEFIGWWENRKEEREAKEKKAKETKARGKRVNDIEAREEEAKENEAKENEAKENEAKENEAKENEAKKNEATEEPAKEPEHTSQPSTTKSAAPTTELTKSLDAPETPPFSLLRGRRPRQPDLEGQADNLAGFSHDENPLWEKVAGG
jgi:FtsZ-interacting cell division protein ZipA